MSSGIAGTAGPDDKCVLQEPWDPGSNPKINPLKRKRENSWECLVMRYIARCNELTALHAIKQAEMVRREAQRALTEAMEDFQEKHKILRVLSYKRVDCWRKYQRLDWESIKD